MRDLRDWVVPEGQAPLARTLSQLASTAHDNAQRKRVLQLFESLQLGLKQKVQAGRLDKLLSIFDRTAQELELDDSQQHALSDPSLITMLQRPDILVTRGLMILQEVLAMSREVVDDATKTQKLSELKLLAFPVFLCRNIHKNQVFELGGYRVVAALSEALASVLKQAYDQSEAPEIKILDVVNGSAYKDDQPTATL